MVHQKLILCKTDTDPVRDLAWCLLKQRPQGVVPMLNDANITPDQIERTSYTTVLYSPIIDKKPVDMTAMYTTMRKCKDLSIALGQHHAFQTIDQQLYAFALQLK